MSEKRRDVRYPARIAARVIRRNESIELLTNDVSFRGAFIRTDSPPALRQLVKVSFALPEGGAAGGHAMVVHVVQPADVDGSKAQVPGMGIQFWGAIENAKAWERFIYDLKVKERAGVASARFSDKVRRASERFKLTLEVMLGGEVMTTRDVSTNGMAIRTESRMPVGARAHVQIHGGAETLSLDVIVRRSIEEPSFRGLGVEFVDVTTELREAIVRLVHAHAPREQAVFVPPGDPKLL